MNEQYPAPRDPTILMAFEPEAALARGAAASKALLRLLEINREAFIVSIGGKPFLRFEAWQTVGAFFGCTPRVTRVTAMDNPDGPRIGYLAHAVVLDAAGKIRGAAESSCLFAESSWRRWDKAELDNAVRSKAQTRACSKALRSVFAWVVVLAGYDPTPAEEMGQSPAAVGPAEPTVQVEEPETAEPSQPVETTSVSLDDDHEIKAEYRERKRREMFAVWQESCEAFAARGITDVMFADYIRHRMGVESRRDLTAEQYQTVTDALRAAKEDPKLYLELCRRVLCLVQTLGINGMLLQDAEDRRWLLASGYHAAMAMEPAEACQWLGELAGENRPLRGWLIVVNNRLRAASGDVSMTIDNILSLQDSRRTAEILACAMMEPAVWQEEDAYRQTLASYLRAES